MSCISPLPFFLHTLHIQTALYCLILINTVFGKNVERWHYMDKLLRVDVHKSTAITRTGSISHVCNTLLYICYFYSPETLSFSKAWGFTRVLHHGLWDSRRAQIRRQYNKYKNSNQIPFSCILDFLMFISLSGEIKLAALFLSRILLALRFKCYHVCIIVPI